ncbi:MAG: hypothetical protein M1812_002911 [Candelaria pacifica]|nr:MAG: hypothetical protein M1812_002911 [Candelaria pacifica]
MSGFYESMRSPINKLSPSEASSKPRQPNPPLSMYANAVYYANWRIYKQEPPSSLKLGCISHVFYAFAWVKPDGTVYLSDEWADSQIEVDGTWGCLRALAKLKQENPHVKLILSIGGGAASQHFAPVANDQTARHRFAHSAMELINAYGFDGIDGKTISHDECRLADKKPSVDWEHPQDAVQGVDYIYLLGVIREYMPAPQYIVTSALPAGEWALQHINLGFAASYLDYINVMTYDFSGPWVESTGHHAQLYTPNHPHSPAASVSGQSAVNYMRAKGVPANKILLGVPLYGRSFLGTDRVGQRYSGHGGEEGTFDYKDLPRAGAQEVVDTRVGAAFCVGGDGGFVTYDNPQTVKQKASYATQNGLGGLFYWIGTADGQGQRSLIETGYKTLHGV